MIRLRCWLLGHLWGPEQVWAPVVERGGVASTRAHSQCVRCGSLAPGWR